MPGTIPKSADEYDEEAARLRQENARLGRDLHGAEQRVTEFERENAGSRLDLSEALEQQTATADVLRVIAPPQPI